MALLDLLRRKPEAKSPVARRRKRKTESGSAVLAWMEKSKVVAFAVFVLTVAAIFIVSFVGVGPAAFHILPNQEATIRIIADSDFSFTSAIQTTRNRERLLREVPPVYRVDLEPTDRFETHVRQVLADLNTLDDRWATLSEAERLRELSTIAENATTRGGLQVGIRDLAAIMNFGDAAARERLIVENGLYYVREIQRAGVYTPPGASGSGDDRDITLFNVRRDSGATTTVRVSTVESARTTLRIGLAAENTPPSVVTALFRLLGPGIAENLVFDMEETEALRARMLETMPPAIVRVEAGRSIIEPGTRVSAEQHEMLLAYQQHLNTNGQLISGLDQQVVGRILLVLGVIIVAGFYLRLEDAMTLRSNGRLALLASVLVVSLLLIRSTLEIGNTRLFETSPQTAALLPYVAPTAFAPILIAVLIGAGPAMFSGLLVSIFAAIIFGNRLDILVLSLLTASVASYACRKVRRRSRVVKAGWISGLVLAAFVTMLGLADGMPLDLLARAAIGGQATGLVTGIVVVGLLPLLEGLFKRTTDITLLELTDYNHPLLRRMQMDAPGTYHHSLMVASLSENAANAIGANSLLARVCCMFHDIGKLVKPDYFIENQRGGLNPHSGHSPSFSALVIKSHVKEGVDLAIKHKLPRPVIDVIRQHHGTTLIRYFYQRARDRAGKIEAGCTPDPHSASESTYRYDGPRPQFKESAIILMADSIEAASRSLQKVTPQAVEELIDSIVEEKISDGQIDDAPLTIREIALIKRSFTFTLLNSLHSRVVYPKADKPAERATATTSPTPIAPAEPESPTDAHTFRTAAGGGVS
ncbi:hypothetical protein ASA1KI_39200 [Opitutales bacterium ASA1]|uniref:HD family phosphohydrolase n=1 Tax=Congregicoccus parvus TaxID=3081749 RepID=UPI002B2C5599|nr:hypothetical protein ASA1KI_39200 [Opitutales bacterium ASA1]